MFDFLKKKTQGTKVIFKIDGMHCTSCSMNIDGELEETKGVLSASTSYAKATTIVEYDEKQISKKQLCSIIESLGYSAEAV